MNIHKNARLTIARRREMVQDVLERKLTYTAAAASHGVSVPTVRKWVGRFLSQGEAGLQDASSRPQLSWSSTCPCWRRNTHVPVWTMSKSGHRARNHQHQEPTAGSRRAATRAATPIGLPATSSLRPPAADVRGLRRANAKSSIRPCSTCIVNSPVRRRSAPGSVEPRDEAPR
jgi:transposase-like protein